VPPFLQPVEQTTKEKKKIDVRKSILSVLASMQTNHKTIHICRANSQRAQAKEEIDFTDTISVQNRLALTK
jgi:hypothetical protein